MANATVDAKGNLVIKDDDGKRLSKAAAEKQHQEAAAQMKHHPLNLYVTHDEDGTAHFWRGDDEISETEWMQQHPNMRGQVNGRDSVSRGVGRGSDSVTTDGPTSQVVSEGLRAYQERKAQRRKEADDAEAQRAGSAGDGVGQPRQRPEPADPRRGRPDRGDQRPEG
jgi:hypothetical protein